MCEVQNTFRYIRSRSPRHGSETVSLLRACWKQLCDDASVTVIVMPVFSATGLHFGSLTGARLRSFHLKLKRLLLRRCLFFLRFLGHSPRWTVLRQVPLCFARSARLPFSCLSQPKCLNKCANACATGCSGGSLVSHTCNVCLV